MSEYNLMLSVIMLYVVMLSVVAPSVTRQSKNYEYPIITRYPECNVIKLFTAVIYEFLL